MDSASSGSTNGSDFTHIATVAGNTTHFIDVTTLVRVKYTYRVITFNATGSSEPSGGAVHQLGIDHRKLTFRHNGIDRRLTDVHGDVIHDIIA